MIDKNNPTNNFTVGNTFWKWILTDGGKLGVWGAVFLIHLFISFYWYDCFGDLHPLLRVGIITILDVGSTILFLYSIYDWRREKNKLKN